jgi:hypothetical protein
VSACPCALCSPRQDPRFESVVLEGMHQDLLQLRAGHDALVAFHQATVAGMMRNARRQHGIRERVEVVARALPQSEVPPLGGALTFEERMGFVEGWDAAMDEARRFILDALEVKP